MQTWGRRHYNRTMGLLIITFIAFCAVVTMMAIGVIFKGRCLLGSCGGLPVYDVDGELLNCQHCPVRREREAQLHPH